MKLALLIFYILMDFHCSSAVETELLVTVAQGFQTEIVQMYGLTCENYDKYCENQGAVDLMGYGPCMKWCEEYLCNRAKDADGLQNTLKEIVEGEKARESPARKFFKKKHQKKQQE